MTDQEFDQIMLVLDNVWGGVDEGREAGYRWVLGSYPAAEVAAVVAGMTRENRVWPPKAPEIAARVGVRLAELRTIAALKQRRREIEAENLLTLEVETNPIGGNDDEPQ